MSSIKKNAVAMAPTNGVAFNTNKVKDIPSKETPSKGPPSKGTSKEKGTPSKETDRQVAAALSKSKSQAKKDSQSKNTQQKEPKPPPPPVPICFGDLGIVEDAIEIGLALHANDLLLVGADGNGNEDKKSLAKHDKKLDDKMMDKMKVLVKGDEESTLADDKLEHQTVHTMNAVRATIDVLEDMKARDMINQLTNLIQIETFSVRKGNELITKHSQFNSENSTKDFLSGIIDLQIQVLLVGYRRYAG